MAEEAWKAPSTTAGVAAEPVVQRFSPLPTGTKFGELAIQSVLGAGELGITYVIVHESTNRRFVLKEYLPRAVAFRDGMTVRASSANTPAFAWGLDRFLEEGRALAKIKHQAVVAVQSVNESNGTGYIILTHETGRDLGVWLHELRRPPTQQEMDQLAAPLLDGLNALHNKTILHLDLAPTNILIRENGTPVLVDIGASRLAMRRRLNLAAPAMAKAFMAPEALAGDLTLIGTGSDLYSMAAVFYLAISGLPPPSADKRVLRDELIAADKAVKSTYRPGFLKAIDSGLSFRPDDRPKQVNSWKQDLLRSDAAPASRHAVAEPTEKAAAADAKPSRPTREDEFGSDAGETTPALNASVEVMDNPVFRAVFGAIAGLISGALIGALSSIFVASMVLSTCVTDSCVAPVLPYTTAIGALLGTFIGARYDKLFGKPGKRMH